MNIPPAGRERDKLIAEMKNIEVKCFAPHKVLLLKSGDPLMHWSTSRSDAWSLWDELPEPKDYGINTFGEHLIAWTQDTIQKTISGTSFADAVSKAWIINGITNENS